MRITQVVPWLVRAPGHVLGRVPLRRGADRRGDLRLGRDHDHDAGRQPRRRRDAPAAERSVVGDDPARIEDTWHKIFRAFTYMGSRGAATQVTSAIDIALWDIKGKIARRCRSTTCSAARCGTTARSTRTRTRQVHHPRGCRSRRSADPRLRPRRDQVRSVPAPRRALAGERPLPGRRAERRRASASGRADRADPRDRRSRRRDPHRRARPLRRADRDPAVQRARGRGRRSTGSRSRCPPESYDALRQVREQVSVPHLRRRAAAHPLGLRADPPDGLADYVMPDVTWTGGITELKKIATLAEAYYVPVTPARRERADQPRRRRAGDAHRPELLPHRDQPLRPRSYNRVPDRSRSTTPAAASPSDPDRGSGSTSTLGVPAAGNALRSTASCGG